MAEETAETIETFTNAMFRVYDQDIATREKALQHMRAIRAELGAQLSQSDPEKQKFQVQVVSLWESEGEKGSDAVHEGSLAFALQEGIKAVRTDGQCEIGSVLLVMQSGKKLIVPKSIWESHLPKK